MDELDISKKGTNFQCVYPSTASSSEVSSSNGDPEIETYGQNLMPSQAWSFDTHDHDEGLTDDEFGKSSISSVGGAR